MQRTLKDLENWPDCFEAFKSLTVKQPHADKILYGSKRFEIRSKKVTPVSNVLMTSSSGFDKRYATDYDTKRCGLGLCLIDIIDCIPVKDISRKDWKEFSGLPLTDKDRTFKQQYVWVIDNVRPIYPIKSRGNVGLPRLVFDKGDIRILPETNKKGEIVKRWKWNKKKISKICSKIALITIISLMILKGCNII